MLSEIVLSHERIWKEYFSRKRTSRLQALDLLVYRALHVKVGRHFNGLLAVSFWARADFGPLGL